MPTEKVQTLQKNFHGFHFRMRDVLANPYQLMATPMRNGTNDEAKKNECNNGLICLLCGGFRNYEGTRLPPRARNRRTGFSSADLGFDNFGTSHGFVGILYSGRLPFLYSNHLEGKEENHLVHIGTNSYRRMHVVTSQFPS